MIKICKNSKGNEVLIQQDDTFEDLCVPEGVKEIDAFALAQHRELQKLTLPDSLEKIGAHAFYNCRSLRNVSFSDRLADLGDGAFKNCEQLTGLTVCLSGGSMRGLKDMLSDLNQEIEVVLLQEKGQIRAKLIFPYYIMNYEENTPARIVNQIAEGSGIEYRNCVARDGIDFFAYDRLFTSNLSVDIKGSSARLALDRLQYPFELGDTARKRYEDYLTRNAEAISRRWLEKERMDSVVAFLDLGLMDHEFVRSLVEFAREKGLGHPLSMLLDYERSHFGRAKKTYDFF